MDEEIKIELLDINKSPEHFQKVIELWRSNSKTLGFFTLGAFEEYAIKKQIFIALYKNVCVGYLLYRVSKNRSTIVHLCVDSNVRGRGIAKLLFDELKEKTKGLHGIILSCRRDYDASSLWPRLGFVGVNERIGRSYDGKPLTLWWYDHKHPSDPAPFL